MITRRLLIEYLLMVGVPLLLLVAVLHRGRALQAPADVQGNWTIALSGSAASDASCEPLLRKLDGAALSISQSGSYLTASLRNSHVPALKGRSEGPSLWLESDEASDPRQSAGLLRLTGSVSAVQGGRLIRGTLLMPRNVDCPPFAFHATWQSDNSDRARIAER